MSLYGIRIMDTNLRLGYRNGGTSRQEGRVRRLGLRQGVDASIQQLRVVSNFGAGWDNGEALDGRDDGLGLI